MGLLLVVWLFGIFHGNVCVCVSFVAGGYVKDWSEQLMVCDGETRDLCVQFKENENKTNFQLKWI